jgi:hypothetical protein
VLADLRQENADAAAKILKDACFSVSTQKWMFPRARLFKLWLKQRPLLEKFTASSMRLAFLRVKDRQRRF